MSIDARIKTVMHNGENDSTGVLHLESRGVNPAGQPALSYENAPHEVTALNGLEIWGGSSVIMLGDKIIAGRIGYTHIRFVDRDHFLEAVRLYHEKHRREDAGSGSFQGRGQRPSSGT